MIAKSKFLGPRSRKRALPSDTEERIRRRANELYEAEPFFLTSLFIELIENWTGLLAEGLPEDRLPNALRPAPFGGL